MLKTFLNLNNFYYLSSMKDQLVFNFNELSFITDSLNQQWLNATNKLKRNDLGDIERRQVELEEKECLRLMKKMEPHL